MTRIGSAASAIVSMQAISGRIVRNCFIFPDCFIVGDGVVLRILLHASKRVNGLRDKKIKIEIELGSQPLASIAEGQ